MSAVGEARSSIAVTRTAEIGATSPVTVGSARDPSRPSALSSLPPHKSRDPAFVEKVQDVVGLYLDPPDKALVPAVPLAVDEKSQLQALDRTQPGLPMKKGRAGTMTHDDKRHGTETG
jgi:hypothetical protein